MTSSDMQDTPAGRRAGGADGPRSSQPKRRTFTAAYKLAMIEKYDAATEPGAKGALLRGEGLYDSHISYWRKARDSGGLRSSAAAVSAAVHKGRPGTEKENERLRKRLARAEVKLDQTRYYSPGLWCGALGDHDVTGVSRCRTRDGRLKILDL